MFWPLLADSLQDTPGEMTFEEILATVRGMPAEELQENIFSGIFHDAETVKSLTAGKKSLRQVLTQRQAARRGAAHAFRAPAVLCQHPMPLTR